MAIPGLRTNNPQINQWMDDSSSGINKEASDKASDEEAYNNAIGQLGQGAQSFRAGLPGQIETSQGFSNSNIRNGLYNQLQGIKSNASAHGLLNSGLRGAQEAGARAGAAQDMLTANRGIRSQLYGQAQDLEGQSIRAGLGQQQFQMNRNLREYNNALDKRMQRQQMGNQVGGLVGGIGGLAAGGAFGGGSKYDPSAVSNYRTYLPGQE